MSDGATMRSIAGSAGPPLGTWASKFGAPFVRLFRYHVSMADANAALLQRWKEDPGGTYRTWFLWDERLKNFRSIRRGIQVVVEEIERGSFGNQYRGSSLETVVASVAEQRQMFRGADHAFLWKPKLRIPDIYEDAENQRAFGRFLDRCSCCDEEGDVLRAIRELDAKTIKGLGPAAANLLYFLHPTLVPPFNTAIVAGYNALMGAKVKLGSWQEYLAMREGVLRLNRQYRALLSNDLGAIAGLLFDLGAKRYPVPPRSDDAAALAAWQRDLATVRDDVAKERKLRDAQREADTTHTMVQAWLRDLGLALGFRVYVAANDRGRVHEGATLGDKCLAELPASIAQAGELVKLIDVLWLSTHGDKVEAAFEVEHTTSIHSGIVRLLDLAYGLEGSVGSLLIVAPDAREQEVRAQLQRPAFRRITDLGIRYLPYGELEQHRHAMARFGVGVQPVLAAAKTLP
jgi:type II restriction enzyme